MTILLLIEDHIYLKPMRSNPIILSVLWTDMVTQALELSNQPHVVVATPGRLADHVRSSNTFSMSKIKFLVSSESKLEWDPFSSVCETASCEDI